jgi:Family of unknown function (DUF6527)
MGQISQFLRGGDGFIAHFCPGCAEPHFIHISKPSSNGSQWSWDGNIVEPTIEPSVNIHKAVPKKRKPYVCHYRLQHGEIHYLDDCTHMLRGITMRLPPLPEYLRDRCLI